MESRLEEVIARELERLKSSGSSDSSGKVPKPTKMGVWKKDKRKNKPEFNKMVKKRRDKAKQATRSRQKNQRRK